MLYYVAIGIKMFRKEKSSKILGSIAQYTIFAMFLVANFIIAYNELGYEYSYVFMPAVIISIIFLLNVFDGSELKDSDYDKLTSEKNKIIFFILFAISTTLTVLGFVLKTIGM